MNETTQSVFAAFGVEAAAVNTLALWMTIGAVAIFVAVLALFVVALQARGGSLSHDGGMRLVLWAGAIVPSIVLLVLLVVSLPTMRPLPVAAARDLTIAITGEQFWWRVRYRPPGAAPVDSANEVRIPVGRTVALKLAATDVLHSFWVPGLAGKMDMIPGRTNTLVVRATRAGRFRGQCAEFCGLGHALMAFDVVAMEAPAFDRWLDEQRAPVAVARGEGAALYDRHGCAACHAIGGDGARIGPDLTRYGARATLAAGMVPMGVQATARFVRDAPAIKPGARMPAFPDISAREADAIARYLTARK